MAFADYGPPRRVAGGLRARSARGSIGKSWWSRRFLDVLESFALGTRLTRGRSYARAGQVLSLDVAPGKVTASVQGSRAKPYRVTIGLRAFAEPVWQRLEVLLAAQALYSARLLAGDLPPDLEQVFVEAGAPLFPGAVEDLDLRCNCPDFAVPCKHLAATFYLLAEVFDADPFQLLHWRGRSRARLLARLRALRARDDSDTAPRRRQARRPARGVPSTPAADEPMHAARAAPVGATLALADLPEMPLDGAMDRFWLPPVPLAARAPTVATDSDLLLRQLASPAAAIGGPGLVERLRRAYERFGAGDSRPEGEPPDDGRGTSRT